jgi:hypothetical protein
MKTGIRILMFAAWMALLVAPAVASDLYIYPNKGQSKEQMEKDKYDCYSWAKQQTGFDPMQAPTASSPPPDQTTSGGVVSGAAKGAALGAIGGAIAGDAGKGAAIGAGTGAAMGGMRRRSSTRQNAQEQAQWEQQQKAQYEASRNEYNRAYGACLQGRDYTVK